MQKEMSNENKRSELDFEKKVFRKYPAAQKFMREVEMSRAAYKISTDKGGFKTPKIVETNKEQQEIIFELISGTQTLRQYFIKKAKFGASSNDQLQLGSLFQRVGTCLAIIHAETKHFDTISKVPFPDNFFDKSLIDTPTFLHGDFTCSNVLYRESDDQLFLIDWNISPFFQFSSNFGPRYWDLSFFICSLFYASFSTFFSFSLKKALSQRFISGYLSHLNLDEDHFLVQLSKFVQAYNYFDLYKDQIQANSKISSQLLMSRSRKQLGQFIKEVPTLLQD